MLDSLSAVVMSILLAEQFQYIVPVQGRTNPVLQGGWEATVVVVNPWDEQLVLTLEDSYPLNGQAVCAAGSREFIMPARGTARIFAAPSCPFQGLHALRFTTEKPVIPINDVMTVSTCGAPQTIPVETAWFPANSEVLIPRVDFRQAIVRLNLVLINPNAQPIIATYRRFAVEDQIEYDVLLPPRSLTIHPVTTADFFCNPILFPGPPPDEICGIAVRANGMFYAGASLIQNGTNDAVYRRATLLGTAE